MLPRPLGSPDGRVRTSLPKSRPAHIYLLMKKVPNHSPRCQADLGAVTASDMTLDFILDERARELISEENRRMMLVRTGKLKERIALNGDDGPANKITSGFQE